MDTIFPAVATRIFSNREASGVDGARFNLGTEPFKHAPGKVVSFLKAAGCTHLEPISDVLKGEAHADPSNVTLALLRQLNRNAAIAHSVAAVTHQTSR